MDGFVDRAKAYLDARRGERSRWANSPAAVGASPIHLQRRFKEAFGVSPRDYQDAHRLESVKSSLQNGRRVADAVFEAGYGSVSRFYEKPLLGMKARDYRAKGKGQRIAFCSFPSRLGTVLVAATEKGVCSGSWGKTLPGSGACSLRSSAKRYLRTRRARGEKKAVLEFIAGEASYSPVAVDIRGTVFQRRVWDELRRIPRGETRTYGRLPAVGAPEAVRAVGSAAQTRWRSWSLCHRAVRTDGGLGGYAWGLGRRSSSRWKRPATVVAAATLACSRSARSGALLSSSCVSSRRSSGRWPRRIRACWSRESPSRSGFRFTGFDPQWRRWGPALRARRSDQFGMPFVLRVSPPPYHATGEMAVLADLAMWAGGMSAAFRRPPTLRRIAGLVFGLAAWR